MGGSPEREWGQRSAGRARETDASAIDPSASRQLRARGHFRTFRSAGGGRRQLDQKSRLPPKAPASIQCANLCRKGSTMPRSLQTAKASKAWRIHNQTSIKSDRPPCQPLLAISLTLLPFGLPHQPSQQEKQLKNLVDAQTKGRSFDGHNQLSQPRACSQTMFTSNILPASLLFKMPGPITKRALESVGLKRAPLTRTLIRPALFVFRISRERTEDTTAPKGAAGKTTPSEILRRPPSWRRSRPKPQAPE